MTPDLEVDLRKAPELRWRLPSERCEQARKLLTLYSGELGQFGDVSSTLMQVAPEVLPAEIVGEMNGLSADLDVPFSDLLLGNLYYDLIKFVFGCTAFAVDTPDGPIHARNLDWWTENAMLSDFTMITRFVGGAAGSRRWGGLASSARCRAWPMVGSR